MSLVGLRPRSVYGLPPKRPVGLPRAGDCLYCGRSLRTDYDAQTHRCDRQVFEARRMFRQGISSVRL